MEEGEADLSMMTAIKRILGHELVVCCQDATSLERV